MRIAIINLTAGGISGGYRVYLGNILPRVAAVPEVEQILCLAPPSLRTPDWVGALPKVQYAPLAPFRFLRHRPDRDSRRTVRHFSADLVFIPVERYLDFGALPIVTMVQNMGPLVPVDGNPISERMRYMAQRYETKLALKKATRIVVPTNFVRDFLTLRWELPPKKIRVIPYGSNAPSPHAQKKKPARVPEAWKGRFLFTAGSLEPYRGLEDVLRALPLLKTRPEVCGLVVAGEARWNMRAYQKKLETWIRAQGLTECVCWAGSLSELEMSWCYTYGRAFVMTSRVESFGITSLEALCHGCVCVVADNPPSREIFGKAAEYYPPGDGALLARMVQKCLNMDEAQRKQTGEIAQKRAASFSWDKNAEQLVRTFREVLNKK